MRLSRLLHACVVVHMLADNGRLSHAGPSSVQLGVNWIETLLCWHHLKLLFRGIVQLATQRVSKLEPCIFIFAVALFDVLIVRRSTRMPGVIIDMSVYGETQNQSSSRSSTICLLVSTPVSSSFKLIRDDVLSTSETV